jgi:hypothetical protein
MNTCDHLHASTATIAVADGFLVIADGRHERHYMGFTKQNNPALEIGSKAGAAEDAAIAFGANRVYQMRARHPVLFGLIAFVFGSVVLAAFTITAYRNWTFEGVDLVTATYVVVIGSFLGGVAAVAAGFAYARTIGPTVQAMRADGITLERISQR